MGIDLGLGFHAGGSEDGGLFGFGIDLRLGKESGEMGVGEDAMVLQFAEQKHQANDEDKWLWRTLELTFRLEDKEEDMPAE